MYRLRETAVHRIEEVSALMELTSQWDSGWRKEDVSLNRKTLESNKRAAEKLKEGIQVASFFLREWHTSWH